MKYILNMVDDYSHPHCRLLTATGDFKRINYKYEI